MDAFYASVEQRDDPSLRGRPVIVGGQRRGVVLASSYEARRYGVRSAMPMARALRIAPRGVAVVRPRFDAYVAASDALHEVLESFTPLVEPLSLDEAFLDVTGSRALRGDGESIARDIRRRIRETIDLPASAGVAPVKFVAKVASDLAKPDGLVCVAPDELRTFLAPLDVGRLWGVGPRTRERLTAVGIERIGDVALRAREDLEEMLGSLGTRLHALSMGVDDRPVVSDREAKSVGAEDTFGDDLSGESALLPHLHSQSLRVARRLRRAGRVARVVVLKLKTADFVLRTRRVTLDAPTDDGQRLYASAAALLAREAARGDLPPMRLTGVSATGLDSPRPQLGLFDAPVRRTSQLNGALDAIAKRFGVDAVRPADVVAGGVTRFGSPLHVERDERAKRRRGED